MAVEIRKAELKDCPALARLMTQLGYETSPDEMKERLAGISDDSNYLTLVAADHEQVLGVAGATVGRFYEKNGIYGRLLVLAVEEKFRGRGIGAALVADVERELKKRGVYTLIVNSGNRRQSAHRFYERLGFEATGIRFVRKL